MFLSPDKCPWLLYSLPSEFSCCTFVCFNEFPVSYSSVSNLSCGSGFTFPFQNPPHQKTICILIFHFFFFFPFSHFAMILFIVGQVPCGQTAPGDCSRCRALQRSWNKEIQRHSQQKHSLCHLSISSPPKGSLLHQVFLHIYLHKYIDYKNELDAIYI